jgi:tellurite resistance protein TehA-like permease
MALSTLSLGHATASPALLYLGTIFAFSVMLFWGICAVRTTICAIEGSMFYAPCLDNEPLLAEKFERDIDATYA